MRVGNLLAVTTGLVLVLAVIGVGLALSANGTLGTRRHLLLDEIAPALRAALQLENALVNEETGVRGYIIAREASFLAPYYSGRRTEARAVAEIDAREHTIGPGVTHELALVRADAAVWRGKFVAPALAGSGRSTLSLVQGEALFNAIRAPLHRLQASLQSWNGFLRGQLDSAANTLELLLIVAGVLILGGVLGAEVVLRLTITRPLSRLGREARRVAGGAFEEPLHVATGPLEVAVVAGEFDAMRERLVAELEAVQATRRQLEEQARELRRSNAELEQFAYVASHDLQEPLRKIASFCQALKARYGGQLDERADQYIEFAVDGAKRMQSLINDLLAFSRVGRNERERVRVDLSEALEESKTALATALEEAQATVLARALPTVTGDPALLSSLFQNLIANAVKFRGQAPLCVKIDTTRHGREWEICCSDNGIGIEPDYAERVFLIFQRLHPHESYEGSGIGLAMCRKIVEYHGGRIWLDTDVRDGACFRFTLPVTDDRADDPHDEEDAMRLQQRTAVEAPESDQTAREIAVQTAAERSR
ncbi:MAG: sensor histidine kinase [Solirubrobacteraceae bacterium]